MRPVLALPFVIALLVSGCGVSYKYENQYPQKKGHPVQVSLGHGVSEGDAAVAISTSRIISVWPNRAGYAIVSIPFSQKNGPCGRPDRSSLVERGRASIPISCKVDPAWPRAVIKTPKASIVSASVTAHRLVVALGYRQRVSIYEFRPKSLVLKRVKHIHSPDLYALSLTNSVRSKSCFLLALSTRRGSVSAIDVFTSRSEHLWRRTDHYPTTGRTAIDLVATDVSDGYILAYGGVRNDLQVVIKRLNTFRHFSLPLRKPTSVVVGAHGSSATIAVSALDQHGRSVFGIGDVSAMHTLHLSRNEMKAEAVIVGYLGSSDFNVVRAASYGERRRLDTSSAEGAPIWTTVRWLPRKKVWMTTDVLNGADALDGEALPGLIALIGRDIATNDTYRLTVLMK